jgi:hypothetical protein
VVGVLAPLLPLVAVMGWMSGQGMSAGTVAGRAWQWMAGEVWSLIVQGAGVVVRSGIFQWLVTTGNDLVGGTRGLSVAAVLFAIAIPVSGWAMVRLLRTPVRGMTHAH